MTRRALTNAERRVLAEQTAGFLRDEPAEAVISWAFAVVKLHLGADRDDPATQPPAVPAGDIEREGAERGLSPKVLRQARRELGATTRRGRAGWEWLPAGPTLTAPVPPVVAPVDDADDPLGDLDLDGAEDRLSAIDEHSGRHAGQRPAGCRCERPAPDADDICIGCGRAVVS